MGECLIPERSHCPREEGRGGRGGHRRGEKILTLGKRKGLGGLRIPFGHSQRGGWGGGGGYEKEKKKGGDCEKGLFLIFTKRSGGKAGRTSAVLPEGKKGSARLPTHPNKRGDARRGGKRAQIRAGKVRCAHRRKKRKKNRRRKENMSSGGGRTHRWGGKATL